MLRPPLCSVTVLVSSPLATSLTPNALYYKEPGSLIHRFVVAGERSRIQDDVHAEATRALREMQASGELTKTVTVGRLSICTRPTVTDN